jgi:prophage endopeptidase
MRNFPLILLVCSLCLIWTLFQIISDARQENESLTTQLSGQVAINTKQQENNQVLQKLDTQHTQELANAKSEIDTLRADVAAGRRKLRIQATCPVSEATSSGGVVNAASPQLTESAKQDYYDLLRMMAENRQQTKYLQDYINTECYKVTK